MTTLPKIRRLATVTSVFRQATHFRLWLVPLVIVILAAAGWWIRVSLTESVKEQAAGELEAILDAEVAALGIWFDSQETFVTVLGHMKRVERLAAELERSHREEGAEAEALRVSSAQRELREIVEPLIAEHGYVGYIVLGPDGLIFAASGDEAIGTRLPKESLRLIAPVLVGTSLVTHPFMPELPLPDRDLGTRLGHPTMAVAGPIRDDSDRIASVLALIIRPEDDFTRILRVARLAESGETYAFDANGLMLSQSRFDGELRRIGLLPADEGITSELKIAIRDPGGSLAEGFSPSAKGGALPLTRMAASAVTGESGVDVDGYRDYRGVMVVGAWTWIPEHGLGVATEMDLDEAMSMSSQTRRILWTMIGVLGLGAALVLGGAAFLQRLGRRMDQAVMEARTLGQYTLEKKLGAGGMGEVYRARHALLRRPTAVKILHPGRSGPEHIARFEREVQMTSRLTHPNTIEVYDYGKTADGVFYYAMEFLPGINLADLVRTDGPQSEGRVIHLLLQVCGSLADAHAHGLIHRDIKPENIILCERGGVYDMAKVLDFGIVKDLESAGSTLTTDGAVPMTPQYVSPESLRAADKIDARADLYSLGAVTYFLLTGETVFEAEDLLEMCNKHLRETPVPPSERAGRTIAPDLEKIVMSCLEKDPRLRPLGAGDLADQLAACRDAGSWDQKKARAWWSEHPEIDTQADEETLESPRPVEETVVEEVTATIVVGRKRD